MLGSAFCRQRGLDVFGVHARIGPLSSSHSEPLLSAYFDELGFSFFVVSMFSGEG